MKHESYKEYVDELISMVPEEVEENFIIELKKRVMMIAEQSWTDYVSGKTSTYTITEQDLETAWKESSLQIVSDSLLKLSELGLVKTAINENGEIVYSISENGQKYIENLNK